MPPRDTLGNIYPSLARPGTFGGAQLPAVEMNFSVVEGGRGQEGSRWRGILRLYRAVPTGLRGGIAAGDMGCARVAVGKRQIDQKASVWAV